MLPYGSDDSFMSSYQGQPGWLQSQFGTGGAPQLDGSGGSGYGGNGGNGNGMNLMQMLQLIRGFGGSNGGQPGVNRYLPFGTRPGSGGGGGVNPAAPGARNLDGTPAYAPTSTATVDPLTGRNSNVGAPASTSNVAPPNWNAPQPRRGANSGSGGNMAMAPMGDLLSRNPIRTRPGSGSGGRYPLPTVPGPGTQGVNY